MAERNQVIIPAPILGLHRGLPSEQQAPGTSFELVNVRPEDTTSERLRMGQRPGLVKAYTTQVSGGARPVLSICSVVTTYIEPV
jgi:hypothetical protein